MATTKASFGVIDDVSTDLSASATSTQIAGAAAAKAYTDAQITANAKLYNYTYADVTAATAATSVTAIPVDDTVPQSSEGYEWVTHSHTPASDSNILKIRATCHIGETTNTAAYGIQALFKNSDANALAASMISNVSQLAVDTIVTEYVMTAGTTSAITFKARASLDAGTTMTINGFGGARKFGGVLVSRLEVFEFLP